MVLRGIFVNGTHLTWQAMTPCKLGLIQMLDDWGPDLTFEKLNVYTDDSIRLGRDRVRESVILPYSLARSSRSFSYYKRM